LSLLPMLETMVTWTQDPSNPAPWITAYYIASSVLTPILAIGAGVYAFVKRDAKRFMWLVVATWVLFNLLDLIFQIIWLASQGAVTNLAPDTIYGIVLPIIQTQELYAFASLIFLLNPILAIFAVSAERKVAVKTSATTSAFQTSTEGEQTVSNQQPTGYDPQTGAPIYGQGQPVGYDSTTGAPIYAQSQPGQPQAWPKPESQLPLVSLILAFFFPIAGIVVGHIALGQMRRNEIPSTNEGMAKAGLILSYVFTALTVIVVVAYIAIFASIMGGGYYY
ncbi:MAG: hypothetical protein RIS80_875, partial [Actinomycetota bacterium]